MNSNKKSRKRSKKLKHVQSIPINTDEKERLYRIIKDRSVNHIFFYEKYMNNAAVESLRTKINSYNHVIPGTMLNKNIRVWSNPNPILLHVHCPGGDVDAGLSAMKLIYKSTVPIITVVDGISASAATYMCMISKLRLINPHGHMLIHQPTNNFPIKGKFQNIEDKYLRIKKYMNTLKKIYKTYSTINETTLNKILSQDIYMDATTCKKYGLVDKIIEY